MATYRYNFQINAINTGNRTLRGEVAGLPILDPEDKVLLAEIKALVGTPISIIFEDPKDFPNEGFFFAKSQAEDKAAEVVATALGHTWGGTIPNRPTYIEDAELKGALATCKIVSIEQLP